MHSKFTAGMPCAQVRSAFFRFAGNQDVVSYMAALGFDMPRGWSQQGSQRALIRAAIQVRTRTL